MSIVRDSEPSFKLWLGVAALLVADAIIAVIALRNGSAWVVAFIVGILVTALTCIWNGKRLLPRRD